MNPHEQQGRGEDATTSTRASRPPDDEIPADARVMFSKAWDDEPTAAEQPVRMEELIRACRG